MRMGRDKALLIVGDQPLWQRQWELLAAAGASERLLSVRSDQGWLPPGAAVVRDPVPDAGPLAGIVAALEQCSAPLLLVLAVDLPGMTAGYLQKLLGHCTSERGAVPWRRAGRPEPLCAVYPRALAGEARTLLRGGHNAVTGLASAAGALGLVRPLVIEPGEEPLFTNWNEPGNAPSVQA